MGTWIFKLCTFFNDASRLIAPQRCILCGRRLHKGENVICTSCCLQLPFTRILGKRGNKLEVLFMGQFPIVRANACLHYLPDSQSSMLFLQMKYGNRPDIGIFFGKFMAYELMKTDFFDDIDCIVPIPLTPKRRRQRGYNQSEMLARGISEATHIPVDIHSVVRNVFKGTQTMLNEEQRKANVKNAFALSRGQSLENCHVLLVDDILTTGATLISCAQEIMKAKNVRISIMTLGLAKSHFAIDRTIFQEQGS